MIVRQTTMEERDRVDELFAIAFEQALSRNDQPQEEDPRVHNWAAFDECGDMMSMFFITDFNIHFDGKHCKMGGIGGVATLPQFRRQGGIRGCFNKALPNMYENGYDFSYLYPFSTAYYRQFGYENCVQKYQVAVDLSLLKVPKPAGTFRLAESRRPMIKEIRALDSLWASRFNMMVLRDEAFYRWTEKFDPAASLEFTYVYFGSENSPKAYTTFRMENQADGRNLVCSRFCFADKEGFNGLMGLFKSLSADHAKVKFTLPMIPAMMYLCPEWSLGAAQWHIQPAGMVRAVNVRSVLEKAQYIGSGHLVLEILDPQISENNRRFSLSFAEGRAVSVTSTQAEPDAVLTIPTFSALITGVWDFADAKNWMDGLEIKNAGACFESVFYRKNLMIADYF